MIERSKLDPHVQLDLAAFVLGKNPYEKAIIEAFNYVTFVNGYEGNSDEVLLTLEQIAFFSGMSFASARRYTGELVKREWLKRRRPKGTYLYQKNVPKMQWKEARELLPFEVKPVLSQSTGSALTEQSECSQGALGVLSQSSPNSTKKALTESLTRESTDDPEALASIPFGRAIGIFKDFFNGYKASGRDSGALNKLLKLNPITEEFWIEAVAHFAADKTVYTQKHSLYILADKFQYYLQGGNDGVEVPGGTTENHGKAAPAARAGAARSGGNRGTVGHSERSLGDPLGKKDSGQNLGAQRAGVVEPGVAKRGD